MRITRLKMASHASVIVDDDSPELSPLENSTSTVWKFFGFPSRDGKIIESDKKKRKRVFVNYVNAIIPTLEIQRICGSM